MSRRNLHFHRFLARSFAGLLIFMFVAACNLQQSPQTTQTAQERYKLTDDEAATWDRLHIAEAESAATAIWGHIGRGEFDQAMLLVDSYGDSGISRNFENRIQNVWAPVLQWPAASFSAEPQIGLGKSETVGFRTWGELLTSGFQRVTLANDSITVYFILNGYWQTETTPVYAAVACGDFGEESPGWRPFTHVVFSADASEETIKATGQAYFAQNLDEFIAFLRKRTFGTF